MISSPYKSAYLHKILIAFEYSTSERGKKSHVSNAFSSYRGKKDLQKIKLQTVKG
jgi:hypothetical protein